MGRPAIVRTALSGVGSNVRNLGKILVSAHNSVRIRQFLVVRYPMNVENVADILVEWRIFRDVTMVKGLSNAKNVEKPSDTTHYLFDIR